MKTFEDLYFRIVLSFGWLVGSFPTQSPIRHFPNLAFKWVSISTAYTVTVLLIELGVQLDYLVTEARANLKILAPTAFIMEFGLYFVALFGDIFRRFNSIQSCRTILRLMRMESEVGIKSEPNGTRTLRNHSVTILILGTLSFIQSCLLIAVHLDSFKSNPGIAVLFEATPYIGVVLETFRALGSLFTLNLTIVLGQKVMLAFEGICQEFKQGFLVTQFRWSCFTITKSDSNSKGTIEAIALKGGYPARPTKPPCIKSINANLIISRRMFEEFDSLVGPYLLTLLLECTFKLIYYGYGSIYRGRKYLRIMSATGFGIATAVIMVLIYEGSHLKSRIEKQKRTIQEALLSLPNTTEEKELVQATGNFICSWNWELSAMSLFSFNQQLIPKILGTIMTYIIFLFQLKITEKDEYPVILR